MRLNPEEVEEAAERLARSSLNKNWDDLPRLEKDGFRQVVRELALSMPDDRTPEAVKVFMLWMSDDKWFSKRGN